MKRDLSGIIILLGAPNDDAGRLSSIAEERCRQALVECRSRSGYAVLPTGGFGEHFNRTAKPHAHYTRRYLLEHGVPAPAILEPVHSSSTREDAALSRPVVVSCGVQNVVVVNSDFHVARAELIFGREFGGFQLSFCASTTALPGADLEALAQHEQHAVARLKRFLTQGDPS